MNHRQRLLAALRRENPDSTPFDLRFTRGAWATFHARTGASDPQDYFDIDYRFAPLNPPRTLPDFTPYFAGRVPDWPAVPWAAFQPELMEPGNRQYPHFFRLGERTAINEWGEYRIFDEQMSYHRKIYPLDDPEVTPEQVDAYPFPDVFAEERYDGVAEGIAELHRRGLADLFFLEMTIFEKAWRIRGMENLLVDFLVRPAVAERVLDQVASRTRYIAGRYAAAGCDIICLGDDVGSERSMLMAPRLWRKWLKPRLAATVEAIKQANPATIVFYHSDGSIEPVVPDLVEIGIDVLNPVQPEAVDTPGLMRTYGSRLSFWGGIGVQTTLPFGAPEDVRRAVRDLIGNAGPQGGLVVAPSHVIEPDVPWENIEAFVEAVRLHGRKG